MSTAQPFVHLHVHTEYSLLDGLSKIDKLVARAKALEMKHLAISDHGAMHGVFTFYKACTEAGIKPIIGMEGYLAKQDMRIHDSTERQPYHLLLLARDETGYKNLLKIATAAQLEGFYNRPRIDKEFLAAHAKGLICTSGCLAAEIPRMISEGREEEARKQIGWYQDVFGKENFFLELQYHEIPELLEVNRWLVENKEYAGVPLIATNDVHYVLQEDSDAHDTLLCIQTNALKSTANRMRMTDDSYFLRSQKEMWEIFGEVPEALENTLRIAEMCDVNLDHGGYHLPVFPVPREYKPQTYLRYLTERGLQWRFGDQADNPDIVKRLDYELDTIHRMGFDTYFLIVWDLCQFARRADIWWNVRGSAAGSLVAYNLGITNIDPFTNDLIFERFLNPGRQQMPDIDIDFPDDRRMEMIDYAMHKYGAEKVAAIITFGTLKSRAAIKDVARALDWPLPAVNNLTRMVPQIPSRPVTLAECLSDDPEKAVPDLKKIYAEDEATRKLLDMAITVEGVARNAGTHAAGIIIADQPLIEYLPLHRPMGESAVDQVTQFTMEVCEKIGLLKIDFLGLSTLTQMRKASDLIEKYHGIRYTIDNIPYKPDPDNPEVTRMVEKAFELIGAGETTGVFQLEGGGMTRMLVEMKPTTFEHIIAAISLFRPGPMELIPTYIRRMHGKEAVKYHHPKLELILKESYGICVYQEQIQQIAAQLFGYSLGDADMMRRAVSKKKAKDLATHKQIFLDNGPRNGVSVEVAEKIFGEIEYFAAYGFNKSHAADYAVLTCQTAFLKSHYPEEFYTALLTVNRDKSEDVRMFTADCRRFGIPILPPDVNFSDLDFLIETLDEIKPDGTQKRGIRYGMAAIKNVGEKAAQQIIDARNAGGPFRDIGDFCRRVDLRSVGKRAVESLIKVGAMDSFTSRDQLLLSLDQIQGYSGDHHKAKDIGQISMFDSDDLTLPPVKPGNETPQREKLRWEKDLIGLYVSEHPLTARMDQIRLLPNIHYSETLRRSSETMHNRVVTIVGLVTAYRTIVTKRGDTMAIVSLEDIQGNIDCVMFARTWAEAREMVEVDRVIIVMGKVDTGRGDVQILADRVSQNFEVTLLEAAPQYSKSGWDQGAPDWAYTPDSSDDMIISEDDALDSRELDDDDEIAQPVMAQTVTVSPSSIEPPLSIQPNAKETGNGHEPPEQRTNGTNGTNGANGTNGNGYSPSTQDLDEMQPLEAEPILEIDPDASPRLVTITIQISTDRDKERRRVNRIYRKLLEYPGNDKFCFRLVSPDQRERLQPFENDSTHFEAVADFLRKECGSDAIEVIELD